MYVFTKEELKSLKFFYDKGAKWASRDPHVFSKIDFWATKPHKNCLDMYVEDKILFSSDNNFVPSIKPGDLVDLDSWFADQYKEKKTSCLTRMFIGNCDSCHGLHHLFAEGAPSWCDHPEYFDTDSKALSCCCCDGTLSVFRTESADYYRGKCDGFTECFNLIRKEDTDGGN